MDNTNINYPNPGDFYRHFKGNIYQVKGIASECEDMRKVVVYQAMYPPYGLWVRDLEEFTSLVPEGRKSVNEKYRFEKISLTEENAKKTDSPTEFDNPTNISNTRINQFVSDNANNSPDVNEETIRKQAIDMFLDADKPSSKKEVIRKYRKYLDEKSVSFMALSMDLTLAGDDIDNNISHILHQLNALERYDGSRLRM